MNGVYLLIGFFGLFLGSFLFAIADRIGKGQSFIVGRSQCNHCSHVLSWHELVPVLSFLFQAAQCRHCGIRLSFWYPLSEILTSIVLMITVMTFISEHWLLLVTNVLIVLCLLVIFFTDQSHGIIPFPFVFVASFLAVVHIGFTSSFEQLFFNIVSGLASGLFFLVIFLMTKGKGMGFGDVMYATFMGFFLGFPATFFGLYIAFASGAVVALLLVILKKKKLHGGTVPFGPFLVTGTFIMMIWKEQILHVVSKLLSFS